MNNTKVHYMYRDASNYKKYQRAVIKGVLTDEQKEKIISCLFDGAYFIPEQVGLLADRFNEFGENEDDHVWFELGPSGEGSEKQAFEETKESVDTETTAAELFENFLKAEHNWNVSAY